MITDEWALRDQLPAGTAATFRELIEGTDTCEAPSEPADYCRQCGKPLTRCREWTEGDYTEADLL